MKKQIMENCKRTVALVASIFISLTSMFLIPTTNVQAANVKPSNEDYELSFKGFDTFFGNATPVEFGTEVYLTYTVEEIREDNASTQNGVIATDQPEAAYPYLEGGILQSSNTAPLLEKGATYFFRFKYTEEQGFEYVAAKSKGDESKYIVFDSSTANAKGYEFTDKPKHFGVWFGGIVSVRLKNVRCYTENGKDLGVLAPKHYDSLMDTVKSMSKANKLNHSYTVKVTDGRNVAISNKVPTDANTVYMEYTVKSNDSKITQYGLINHTDPTREYPHSGHGQILVESLWENGELVSGPGYLLQEGASYIIRFERKAQYFLALIQKTYKGKTEMKEPTSTYGDYILGAQYFAFWSGEGANCPITFELENFKCYDADLNNLAVTANSTASSNKPVEIVHYGELEDYTGCEAMYYSKDTNAIIALYADKTAKVTRDGKTEYIVYSIVESTLILQFPDRQEEYEYFYQGFTDNEGRRYVRLAGYYVTFETGTDEKIERQKIDGAVGYRATKPEMPVKEGAEFLGWFTSDDTEFDFDTIVDESITLYAKWSDAEEYLAIDALGSIPPVAIPVAISLVIIVAGVVCGTMIDKKGKKDETEKTN